MTSKQQNPVVSVYQTVIEDVINNVRELFLDDGVDEQVLQELKQIWEGKLRQTRAVDSPTMSERSRPQMYAYMPQAGRTEGGQQMYRTVQLSAASQQAMVAVPEGAVYQQGASLRFPAQTYQQYPVRVLQPPLQISHQRPAGGSGQTLVVAPTSQPGASHQQVTRPKNPSGIMQTDGTSDSAEEGPSTSGSCTSFTWKLHPREKCTPKVKKLRNTKMVLQLDGQEDSSSSEVDEDDDDDDDDDDDEDDDEETQEEEKVDEEPLNSNDDDSDQDSTEMFDTDNVIVCQYDKIHRAKTKWKFNLKLGIMNLKGKDHVFVKANGDAEW